MSHISTYQGVKIKDINLFLNCARAKGHQVQLGEQVVRQFGSNAVNAVASVKLQGWRYPLAVTSNGEIKYDHFGSNTNTFDHLGNLVQKYNEEAIAQSIDYGQVTNFYKEKMENGDMKLVFEY